MWSSDDVFLFLSFWKCLSEYYLAALNCDLMLFFLSFVDLNFVFQVVWVFSEYYDAFRSSFVWDSSELLLNNFLCSFCTLSACDNINFLIWHCMWWFCRHDLNLHMSQCRCSTEKSSFCRLWSFNNLCHSILNRLCLNLAFSRISSCILIFWNKYCLQKSFMLSLRNL